MSEKQIAYEKIFRKYLYYLNTQKKYYKEPGTYYLNLLRDLEDKRSVLNIQEQIDIEIRIHNEFEY